MESWNGFFYYDALEAVFEQDLTDAYTKHFLPKGIIGASDWKNYPH